MPVTKHQIRGQGAPSAPVSATRQFTDRESYTEAFDRALTMLPATDGPRILTFYGVGGIGKSTLLSELADRLTRGKQDRPEVVHATLQLQAPEARLPRHALVQLRSQLHDTYGITFPSFDVAFGIYWQAAHPHLPLAKAELRFLGEGELAGDVFAAIENVPGVGILAKIPRVLDKLHRAARDWWTQRGSQELRALMELSDPGTIEEWLSTFWAADIGAWLAAQAQRRLVLFLDTIEALWGGSDGGGMRGAPPDDWVRDWAAHLVDAPRAEAPQVVVVIGGREQLQWAATDSTWDRYIEQHLLGGLAREDADRFLRTAGVMEAEVRAAIVARAEGVPFYLDLAVSTYERIVATVGRVPEPGAFDGNLGPVAQSLSALLAGAGARCAVRAGRPGDVRPRTIRGSDARVRHRLPRDSEWTAALDSVFVHRRA